MLSFVDSEKMQGACIYLDAVGQDVIFVERAQHHQTAVVAGARLPTGSKTSLWSRK